MTSVCCVPARAAGTSDLVRRLMTLVLLDADRADLGTSSATRTRSFVDFASPAPTCDHMSYCHGRCGGHDGGLTGSGR